MSGTQKSQKPPMQFDEQVAILQQRGLIVADAEAAARTLSGLNYYRLRGYYVHLCKNDKFNENTSFDQLVALHDFDTDLRIALLRLILDFEVVIRTRIAYEVGHAWGGLGYADSGRYDDPDGKAPALLTKINNTVLKSRELYVKKYIAEYNSQFPIWLVVETMSMGDLSKLFGLLPLALKQSIMDHFDQLDAELMKSWFQTIVNLRNMCAHNDRIYARPMPSSVKIEKHIATELSVKYPTFKVYPNNLFAVLLALKRVSSPQSWNRFHDDFRSSLDTYDSFIDLTRMGIPQNWEMMLDRKP